MGGFSQCFACMRGLFSLLEKSLPKIGSTHRKVQLRVAVCKYFWARDSSKSKAKSTSRCFHYGSHKCLFTQINLSFFCLLQQKEIPAALPIRDDVKIHDAMPIKEAIYASYSDSTHVYKYAETKWILFSLDMIRRKWEQNLPWILTKDLHILPAPQFYRMTQRSQLPSIQNKELGV